MAKTHNMIFGIAVVLSFASTVSSVYSKTYYPTRGDYVRLSCPLGDSPLSQLAWFKDNSRGEVIAKYSNVHGRFEYSPRWAGDITGNVTISKRRSYMSLKVQYHRDNGHIHCVGINAHSTEKVLADFTLEIYSNFKPVIKYLTKDSVRVYSDTLILTHNETTQLKLYVDANISTPFHVNWIMGDTDITQNGKDHDGLKLRLRVTEDMREMELKVIVVNQAGTDTIVKRVLVQAAPFFVNSPLELTVGSELRNKLEVKFYSVPRFTKYHWSLGNFTLLMSSRISYVLKTNITISVHGELILTSGYMAVLVLRPVMTESARVYTLTVANKFGTMKTSVRVIYSEDGGGEETWHNVHKVAVAVLSCLLLLTLIALVVVCALLRKAKRLNDHKMDGNKQDGQNNGSTTLYEPQGNDTNRYSDITDVSDSHQRSAHPRSSYITPTDDTTPYYITPISDEEYLEMRGNRGNHGRVSSDSEHHYEESTRDVSPRHNVYEELSTPQRDNIMSLA